MHDLLDAYREAYNGSRVAAMVLGEMGSGKSRLLAEFARREELKGAFVVRLRMHEADRIAGLQTLRDTLLETVATRAPLRRKIDSFLSASSGPETIEALARSLDLIGHRVPLVVIIDDLDSAGRELAISLGALFGRVECPFLLLFSINPAFREFTLELCHAAETEPLEVPLELLTSDALADQVEQLLGFRPDAEGSAWLASVTRGLPILVRFALHALMRQGCIALRDGRWRAEHPFRRCHYTPIDALPSLRSRLTELPRDERVAITTAALLGQRLPHAALIRFGFPVGWYQPLVARDVLSLRDRTVEFSHKLLYETALAEAVESGLTEELRASLLELLPTDETELPEVRLPRLTIRALLTGAGEERPALCDRILRAAEIFHHREDYVGAAGHFGECRCYWREIVERHAPLQVARWTNSYAQALFRLGSVAEQRIVLEEFLAPFQDAMPPAELVPDVADAMLALVEALYREKQIDAALEMLDRTRTMLLTLDRREQRVQAAFINVAVRRAALLVTAERYEEAAAIYRSILAQTDDGVYSAAACQALSFLDDYTNDPKVRRRIAAMLAICEREGRRRDAAQLRSHIVRAYFHAGDYDRAEPMVRTLIKETQHFLLPRTESNGWYWLAVIQADRGDMAEALRHVDRTIELRWKTRSMAMWQIAMATKAQFLTRVGRHEEALAVIETLEADAREHGRPCRAFVIEWCRRMIAVRRGGWKQEQGRLEELREIGRSEGAAAADWLLLELESEILLHATRVKIASALDFASRVERMAPAGVHGPLLWVRAAAIFGRAIGTVGGKQQARNNAMLETVLSRTRQALKNWEDGGAPHNVAQSIKLLRTHAATLFDDRELIEHTGGMVSIPAFYECAIISFGRLRVVDISGIERGGRHFGTHKSDSKPRKLLAALVAAAVQDRRLARERLVDMVWGDNVAGDTAANNFHVTLSGLRQVIGDGVDFDGTTYALNGQSIRVDAIEFLRMIDESVEHERAGRTFRAFDLLNAACELYTGEFLEGIFDEWSDGPRDLLRAKARAAHLRLAEIAIGRGEFDTARQTVQRLLDTDAADEEAIFLHLTMLAAEGDRVRALREYDRFASLLQEEYGVKPSRRLRDLRESIAGG